jgi:hypothetical protein
MIADNHIEYNYILLLLKLLTYSLRSVLHPYLSGTN